MKCDVRAVIADCIEKGVSYAIKNREKEWTDEYLCDRIENSIWFEIDNYFTFEDE